MKIEMFNTFIKIFYEKENVVIHSLINYLTFDYTENEDKVEEKVYRLYKHNKEKKFLIAPIGAIEHLIRLLRNFNMSYELISREILIAEPIKDLKLTTNIKPRDYQELYINKLTNKDLSRFLLVDLKPGAGKTFIAVNVALKLGNRIGLIILPKYISKWIDDFKKYCGIDEDKIRIIQGMKSINEIIENKVNVTEDVIIFSVRTCTLWIENYLQNKEQFSSITKLFYNCKIGSVILDEVHQETYAVSRILMYSNIYKVIGLSATYLPGHSEERRLYNVLFKEKQKLSNLVKFDNYINIYAIHYHSSNFNSRLLRKRVKTKYGYSHIKFEQLILANSSYRENYFNMVLEKLKLFYILDYVKNDKCLVYFSTIDGCTIFTKWLEEKFKEDKIKLTIARYVGVDPWENLLNNNVVVTTLGSAGTAVDIPNLTCVFNTVVVRSEKLNIQNIGRLRRIQNREVNYVYFYTDLHNTIETARRSYIRPMAKGYYTDNYRINDNLTTNRTKYDVIGNRNKETYKQHQWKKFIDINTKWM